MYVINLYIRGAIENAVLEVNEGQAKHVESKYFYFDLALEEELMIFTIDSQTEPRSFWNQWHNGFHNLT